MTPINASTIESEGSVAASKDYLELLRDPNWQRKRLEILQRDSFTCRNCRNSDETLHVHHLFYMPDGLPPWSTPDFGLITLCASCHETACHVKTKDDGLDQFFWALLVMADTLRAHGITDPGQLLEFAYQLSMMPTSEVGAIAAGDLAATGKEVSGA
jgi:hypothetical protein